MKAVISGATRGIGKAIAMHLAKTGFELVLLARHQKELNALSKLLHPSKVNFLALDLAKKNSFAVIEKEKALFAKVTHVINNLGVYHMQEADNISIHSVQNQMNVNLYSAIQLTQSVRQCSNIKQVINIGSIMSLYANSAAAAYSISKHAFKGWNDALRMKLSPLGIKVSAIYPGAVNTSSWDGTDASREEMIQAEDIAKAVGYICSLSENALVEEIRISPLQFGA